MSWFAWLTGWFSAAPSFEDPAATAADAVRADLEPEVPLVDPAANDDAVDDGGDGQPA